MREIKFRAWEERKKRMIDVGSLYWNSRSELRHLGYMDVGDGITRIHHFHLLQYTGLKDKNGVEIYEGDVLLIDGETTKVIESEMSWDWDGATVYGWIIGTEDPHKECEVIGNIYENPELIEK